MKKAKYILFEDKKDAQLMEDIDLGPLGRFKKMFMLISMSLFLSPNKNGKMPTDNRFTELKRKS